jgi:hypothetical protein
MMVGPRPVLEVKRARQLTLLGLAVVVVLFAVTWLTLLSWWWLLAILHGVSDLVFG